MVATGRSDFANQVNNSVLFPAVFRGALDVRAKTITDSMVITAARELAGFAKEKGLRKDRIIPTMLDWRVFPRVAAALGVQAQKEGQARRSATKKQLENEAMMVIGRSRKAMQALMRSGVIGETPG